MGADARQHLGEAKRYGIQVGWFPSDVLMRWRNDDHAPHKSTYTDNDGNTCSTMHSTVDFYWTDESGLDWCKTAHFEYDEKTKSYTETVWFASKKM